MMSEKTKDQHRDLRDNKHFIATKIGLAVCVVYGLIARNDLLFGLAMGTIFISVMKAGVIVNTQIAANAPVEHAAIAKVAGSIVAAAIAGIIAAIILAVVNGAVDMSQLETDNIIITIVKHFFDSSAALAVGAGLLFGSLAREMDKT